MYSYLFEVEGVTLGGEILIYHPIATTHQQAMDLALDYARKSEGRKAMAEDAINRVERKHSVIVA